MRILDLLIPEPGSIFVMDRGYVVEIEILLHPQAIGLDSLVIVGRRRETGREGFERRRAAGGVLHLNEFTSTRSVRGVEVYPTIADMPPEIRQGRRAAAIRHCGVVQVWTMMAW